MKKISFILGLLICYLTSFSQETGTFTDERDGKVYKTIKIGKQWIMTENFTYKPESGEFWVYNADTTNVKVYGYLYNWETAVKIVPKGWHIPTIDEWKILRKSFNDMDSNLVVKMNKGDEYSIHVKYGGKHDGRGFSEINEKANFWAFSPPPTNQFLSFWMTNSESAVTMYGPSAKLGLSLRLFKDVDVIITENNKEILIDSRDGKTYKTVKIGSQTWMAENLAFKADSGCWVYDNHPFRYLANYGYLYAWEVSKNVCPTGWHLPSKDEFEKLINNAGKNENEAGKALLPTGTSGFSAQFGGYLGNGYESINSVGYFWSSSPYDADYRWRLDLDNNYDPPKAKISVGYKDLFYSVRCIRD